MEYEMPKSINNTSCSDIQLNNFSNSKISSCISSSIPVLSTFLKETTKNSKELENDEKNLNELLNKLDLNSFNLEEVVTIEKDYDDDDDCCNDDENIKYEYYVMGDGCDPEEIKKKSPWEKDGFIIKKFPESNEIDNFIKNKKCICLLLNCHRIVIINNNPVNKKCSYNNFINENNILNFLCRDHKDEVNKRYVYNSQ